MKKITQLILPLVFIGTTSASAVAPPPPDAMAEIMGEPSASPSYETEDTTMGVVNSLDQFQMISAEGPSNYTPPPPPEEFDSSHDFFFKAGYSSNYSYKGMVLGNSQCKAGDMSINAGVGYMLDSGMILSAKAAYTEIFDGGMKNHDESSFAIALGEEVFPNLMVNFGYGLVHGGLAGRYAKLYHDKAHSIAQEFSFSALYGENTEGFFFGFDTAYSFQGITGWWLGATVGYNHEINESLKAVIKATASSSWSYWAADGVNSINCSVELPYTIKENWIISPFISVNWAGRSALKMNSYLEERVFRPFTLMGGVGVAYKF